MWFFYTHTSTNKKLQSQYLATILKNILYVFLQDFANLTVTQILNGLTICIANQKLCYFPILQNVETIGEQRADCFLRIIGEYGLRSTVTVHWYSKNLLMVLTLPAHEIFDSFLLEFYEIA